ncbi:MAG: transcriptional regulator [Deltaproteobacteria bacterium]|nr:transcriptional regulator [Candidatus Zymogenaceae bacterium]
MTKEPKERGATIRREIIELMAFRPVTIRDISRAVGITEKDAAAHLEHALKSVNREGYAVEVDPACCRQCGFVFSGRKKTKKPSRCPECKEGSIEPAVYFIRKQ